MTTTRTFACNVCSRSMADDSGVSIMFNDSDGDATELSEANVRRFENHLCYRCIVAIESLSIRLREEEKKNEEWALTNTP